MMLLGMDQSKALLSLLKVVHQSLVLKDITHSAQHVGMGIRRLYGYFLRKGLR